MVILILIYLLEFNLRIKKINMNHDNISFSQYLYTEHIKEIIESHPKDLPLFLYFAMQTVHTPLEVPKV